MNLIFAYHGKDFAIGQGNFKVGYATMLLVWVAARELPCSSGSNALWTGTDYDEACFMHLTPGVCGP